MADASDTMAHTFADRLRRGLRGFLLVAVIVLIVVGFVDVTLENISFNSTISVHGLLGRKWDLTAAQLITWAFFSGLALGAISVAVWSLLGRLRGPARPTSSAKPELG